VFSQYFSLLAISSLLEQRFGQSTDWPKAWRK
jgi:hypothetical protein